MSPFSLGLIAFVFISVLFFVLDKNGKSVLSAYTQTVSLLAIFVGLLSLQSQLERDQINDEREARDELVDQAFDPFVALDRLFIDQYPYLDRLHREMEGLPPIALNVDPLKEAALESHVASIVLTDMERLFVLVGPNAWDKPEHQRMLWQWRRWMCTKTMRDAWNARLGITARPLVCFMNEQILPYCS